MWDIIMINLLYPPVTRFSNRETTLAGYKTFDNIHHVSFRNPVDNIDRNVHCRNCSSVIPNVRAN